MDVLHSNMPILYFIASAATVRTATNAYGWMVTFSIINENNTSDYKKFYWIIYGTIENEMLLGIKFFEN